MSADPLAALTGGLFSSLSGATKGLLVDTLEVRTGVRKTVAGRLDQETNAEGRVFPTRVLPLDAEEIANTGPVLLVYCGEETVDPEPKQLSPPKWTAYIELVVEIVASTTLKDPDDVFDGISAAVKAIVLRNETQDGYVCETEFRNAVPLRSNEGEYTLVGLRLTFECEFEIDGSDLPDAEPLRTAGVDWDLGPEPDDVIEAEDEIVFEQE